MHPTRIFKTPDELKIAFDKYKDNLKQQSKEWVKVQYVGKDGDRVEEPQKVPMTLEGFKRYCREHYGDSHQYFINKDALYDDFVPICHAIKEEIRENQITGGLLGFFNPSITQRLNGLVDKKETESNIKIEGISGMEIK
jgi:uncharacterized short protein YbdD (DUF466 family)